MLCAGQSMDADTGARIGPGAGSFCFGDGRVKPGSSLRVWYYRPQHLSNNAPIVFVMHGVRRDADSYRDTWIPAAERFRFTLVCPEFPKAAYPRTAYHLGNMVDGAGNLLPKARWTFGKLERLFDFVRQLTASRNGGYYLYGHSAGAQFVHRLVLFVPEARYIRAIAANAGWYTLPKFTGDAFPYSLKGSPNTPNAVKQAFARRLVVLLGEGDTNPHDPMLRHSGKTDKQGQTRYERGHTFYATAQKQAKKLGVPLHWTLATVPGAAHSDAQMMPYAAAALFRR